MTLSDIATKARSLTGTDSNNYTNAQLLIDLNIVHQKAADIILSAQDESDYDDPNHGDYPTGTFPLTTNRDNFIPTTERILQLKTASISYDGTNYYKSTPIDSNEFPFGQGPASATTQESTIDGLFSKTAPRHDWKYGALFVYPKATQTEVDAGAKVFLEWTRAAYLFTSSDLSTGTMEPGFDTQFHPFLAYGCAFERSIDKNPALAKDLWGVMQDYEARMRRHYGQKQRGRMISLQADLPDYK